VLGGIPVALARASVGSREAIVDGTADRDDTRATPPNRGLDACPCSWVPADVRSFFDSL